MKKYKKNLLEKLLKGKEKEGVKIQVDPETIIDKSKDEKFVPLPPGIDTKDLEVKISIDPMSEVKEKDEVNEPIIPFQYFHSRLTQNRGEVSVFLSELKSKHKLINWNFEHLGGGSYFVVAEVEEK